MSSIAEAMYTHYFIQTYKARHQRAKPIRAPNILTRIMNGGCSGWGLADWWLGHSWSLADCGWGIIGALLTGGQGLSGG